MSTAASANASDAQALYDQAVADYAARGDLARNEAAIQKLEQAKGLDASTDLKYAVHILLSRAYYWKAMNVTGVEPKKQWFEVAMNVANDAKRVSDDYAEAYYYAAIARGRWAEANGIVASLRYSSELMGNCAAAQERITMEGEPGESVDSYGPARTLGRVYDKLPGFAGGSREKAFRYLKEAATNGPEHALNVVYYAEILNSGSQADKVYARELLDRLLATPPEQLNPDRLPEMVEEYAEARALRRSMGR
jgi:hypothetical protein